MAEQAKQALADFVRADAAHAEIEAVLNGKAADPDSVQKAVDGKSGGDYLNGAQKVLDLATKVVQEAEKLLPKKKGPQDGGGGGDAVAAAVEKAKAFARGATNLAQTATKLAEAAQTAFKAEAAPVVAEAVAEPEPGGEGGGAEQAGGPSL